MPATTRLSTRRALADITPTSQPQASQSSPSAAMFTCASCWDEEPQSVAVSVGSDSLCEGCFTNGIKTQFHEALLDETKYPVKYGTDILNIQNFECFFSQEFRDAFSRKEKEYKTPMQERLYCNRVIFVIPADHTFSMGSSTAPFKQTCGSFLGDKRDCLSDVTFCGGCTGPVCSKCSEPLNGAKIHECEKSDQEDDPFREMKRGVDYQICPYASCRMRMMLWDGCNSIRCQYCRTQLCFICGEQPAADHFGVGKCPRFGKKGDSRAIHDADAFDDDRFPRLETPTVRLRPNNSGTLKERLIDTLVRQLEDIHERIFIVSDPRHPDLIPTHEITHIMTTQLERFRTTLNAPDRSFRGSRRFQDQDRAIITAAGRISEEGFQLFPGLSIILASYRQIWADALTDDSMNDTIRLIRELVDGEV